VGPFKLSLPLAESSSAATVSNEKNVICTAKFATAHRTDDGKRYSQGRNDVRWRLGQETSLASPPHNDSAPGELRPPLLPRYSPGYSITVYRNVCIMSPT